MFPKDTDDARDRSAAAAAANVNVEPQVATLLSAAVEHGEREVAAPLPGNLTGPRMHCGPHDQLAGITRQE
jgi:hypothetical protein